MVGSWETLPRQNSTYLLFCTRKYCNTATTNLLCARGRIKTSKKMIRRNNFIMVSTRRSPQKKTRPTGVTTLSGQARVHAERAEQRTEQRSAAARANAPVEETHRPIEEEEVSQLDIVDDDDVYHGNDDDEEEWAGSETMDVDDNEEEQKVDEEEEEEQGGVDVLGTVVLKRERKLALKDTDLCTYFFNLLERIVAPIDHAVALKSCVIRTPDLVDKHRCQLGHYDNSRSPRD